MKVILTYKQEVTSTKSGSPVKYTIFQGISESGETVQLFLNDAQVKEYSIPDGAMANKKMLDDLFSGDLPVIEAEFNQRGRLSSVTV